MDKLSSLIFSGLMSVASSSANAITIDFNYDFDGGFFSGVNESRRATLNAAGSYFETRLNDNLTAITSTGSNSFNAIFDRPDTGQQTTLNNYSVAANTLVVFVGGQALPGSTLGHGGPGGYSASTFQQSFLDNLETRGQGSENVDFGPWGGTLSFDTGTSWYFDLDVNTIDPGLSGINDFYSVAIHELAHVLGYGTSNTWNSLHPGASHWAENTMSLVKGVSQEAAMDPTLTTGTRKYFTDLDLQGLSDIGWEVSAVPVPAAFYLLGSAMIGLTAFRRKT